MTNDKTYRGLSIYIETTEAPLVVQNDLCKKLHLLNILLPEQGVEIFLRTNNAFDPQLDEAIRDDLMNQASNENPLTDDVLELMHNDTFKELLAFNYLFDAIDDEDQPTDIPFNYTSPVTTTRENRLYVYLPVCRKNNNDANSLQLLTWAQLAITDLFADTIEQLAMITVQSGESFADVTPKMVFKKEKAL